MKRSVRSAGTSLERTAFLGPEPKVEPQGAICPGGTQCCGTQRTMVGLWLQTTNRTPHQLGTHRDKGGLADIAPFGSAKFEQLMGYFVGVLLRPTRQTRRN